jgi:VWFA-related protein
VSRTIIGGLLVVVAVGWGDRVAAGPPHVVSVQRIDVSRLPTVDVYLTVADDKANAVLGLTELEVAVAIDATPQKITSLTSALAGGESLAVVLLFDRSGSMKTALDGTRDAAIQFIRRLSVNDRMAVVSFDDTVRVDAPLTNDREALERAVRGITTGTDTALHDAIKTALDLLKGVGTRRQAIVVLSDGKDTKSRLTQAEVLTDAKASGVPIFTLGLGRTVASGALERLARETGGVSMAAARAEELRSLYQAIAGQLANQYVMSFTSTVGSDEAWHRLTVEARAAGGAAVSAQREFIASQGPGVSRELVASYERAVEHQNIARQATVWAVLGLIAGVLIVSFVRVVRPDVSLWSPLTAGIIVLAGLIGGIVAMIVRAVRP